MTNLFNTSYPNSLNTEVPDVFPMIDPFNHVYVNNENSLHEEICPRYIPLHPHKDLQISKKSFLSAAVVKQKSQGTCCEKLSINIIDVNYSQSNV